MTLRERIFAVLEGKRPDKPPWEARMDHWYQVNNANGTLPLKYQNMDILALNKEVGAALRRGALAWRIESQEVVRITVREEHPAGHVTTIETFRTPLGEIRTVSKFDPMAGSAHLTEPLLKTPDDFKICEFVLRDRKFIPILGEVEREENYVGEQGLALVSCDRSPLMWFLIYLMGIERGLLALFDYPREVEAFFKVLEEYQDQIYEQVCRLPVKIVWMPENTDVMIISPALFQKYVLPHLQNRSEQLHAAGKICACHMDGRLKGILPMVKDSGVDIIDAIAPEPMGDVTMDEIKQHQGDLIMWGGMYASIFCRGFSYEDVRSELLRWIDLMGDRMVVSIADMLPPDGDIEKVRLVSEVIESL